MRYTLSQTMSRPACATHQILAPFRSPRPALAVAAALLMGACRIGLPGLEGTPTSARFTYVVRYDLTGTITAAADIDYLDAAGATTTVPAVSAPWSVEIPGTWDYSSPFEPSLRLYNASLASGETAAITISLRDYSTAFGEQVLAQRTLTNGTAAPAAQDYTVWGPNLPR